MLLTAAHCGRFETVDLVSNEERTSSVVVKRSKTSNSCNIARVRDDVETDGVAGPSYPVSVDVVILYHDNWY